MKKLTHERRKWLRHRQMSSLSSRLRSSGRAKLRRRRAGKIRVILDSKRGRHVSWVRERIEMPRNVCVRENYNEVVSKIRNLANASENEIRLLQKRIKKNRKPPTRYRSFYDFAMIDRCTPAAALMIAAEYDRLRALSPRDLPLFNVDDWKPEILQLFDQIGFFALLDIARPPRPPATGTLTVIPFKTGNTFGNQEAGALMTTLAEMVVGADPGGLRDAETRTARTRLYSALVEACENTRRHAYQGAERLHGRKSVARWWMTGSYDSTDKRVTLVVYDQGITIPRSLPHWDRFGSIARAISRVFGRPVPNPEDPSLDGFMLRTAMQIPRSSTGLEYRGKGFPAFKAVLDDCATGSLRIVSRSGEFILEKGKRPYVRQLELPLEGTLVEWDLRL